jgi:hypothetical protein
LCLFFFGFLFAFKANLAEIWIASLEFFGVELHVAIIATYGVVFIVLTITWDHRVSVVAHRTLNKR